MQARTVLDRIEIEFESGAVLVRFLKQIVDDSGRVLSSGYHRTSLMPDMDVDSMFVQVSAHLAAMGYPGVATADVEAIKAAGLPSFDRRKAKADEAAALLARQLGQAASK